MENPSAWRILKKAEEGEEPQPAIEEAMFSVRGVVLEKHLPPYNLKP